VGSQLTQSVVNDSRNVGNPNRDRVGIASPPISSTGMSSKRGAPSESGSVSSARHWRTKFSNIPVICSSRSEPVYLRYCWRERARAAFVSYWCSLLAFEGTNLHVKIHTSRYVRANKERGSLQMYTTRTYAASKGEPGSDT
jgi:hypothetical protein